MPRVTKIKNDKDLLYESHAYIYYYDNFREHFSLDYMTPFAYLKQQIPHIYDNIRYVQPILLDEVFVNIDK